MHGMNSNTPPHENESEFVLEEDGEEIYEVVENEEQEQDSEMDEENMDIEIEDDEDEDEDDEEEDETDINKIVLSMHKDSVFCCELSPSDPIGASGGEDDKAFVFNSETGEVIFECEGHKDSVTNVSFSHMGTYLATSDMRGYLQVWKVSTKTKIWEYETDDINWIIWHQSSNILFAGTTGGEICMWLIPNGNTKSISHSGVSSECGVLTRDGKRLCSGYANGTVKILDLKSCKTLHSLKCSENQITTLSSHQDNSLLLTGSEHGRATLINTNSGREISTFDCNITHINGETINDEENTGSCIEVVSFCPTISDLAVTASLTGLITIWNISSQTSRHHIVQGCGTSSLSWHPSQPYFITSGLDGSLRIYDVRSAEQIFKCKGDGSAILSCHIKKDGSRLIMSTDKGMVAIINGENLWGNK